MKNKIYLMFFLLLTIFINSAETQKHYEDILFYPDSDKIKEDQFTELDRIIGLLKKNSSSKIILHGYTNSTGEPDQEKDLSIKRSLKVAEYLIKNGVDSNRIQSIGYGSAVLKVKKIDEINRRVVIEFDIEIVDEQGINKDSKEISKIIESNKNNLRSLFVEITDKDKNLIQARLEISKFENEIRIFKNEKDINAKEEILVPFGNLTALASAKGYFPKKIQISENDKKLNIMLDKIAKQEKFEVQAIYFDRNSAVIKKESYDILNKIYNILIENPDLKLTVEGHTDSNISGMMELSNERALNVQKYLVKKGIDEKRLNSTGKGFLNPKYDIKENFKNRRIEFYFY